MSLYVALLSPLARSIAFNAPISVLVSRADAVYTGLCEYQDDLNYKISKQVDTINAYGERIAELNKDQWYLTHSGWSAAHW